VLPITPPPKVEVTHYPDGSSGRTSF